MKIRALFQRWSQPAGPERDAAIRRLLEAASADDPGNSGPPPFFAARVRARAKAEGGTHGDAALAKARHPMGLAALQMLPVCLAILVGVSVWTGYESVQFSRNRDAALRRMLQTEEGRGDFLLAAVMFGTSAESPVGGAQ